MPETVVVTDGGEESTEEAVEEVAEAISDAVMDATTVSLVERVTRCEDALTVQGTALQELSEQVQSLSFRDDMQESAIAATQEAVETVAENQEEIAEATADAVEEVVEDIDEASEEIKPDELPTVREHWFFRKFGGKR